MNTPSFIMYGDLRKYINSMMNSVIYESSMDSLVPIMIALIFVVFFSRINHASIMAMWSMVLSCAVSYNIHKDV